MNTTTAAKTKCDKRGCHNDATWAYQVATLYGVETWNACQPHVREVREMHGMNIQSVREIK